MIILYSLTEKVFPHSLLFPPAHSTAGQQLLVRPISIKSGAASLAGKTNSHALGGIGKDVGVWEAGMLANCNSLVLQLPKSGVIFVGRKFAALTCMKSHTKKKLKIYLR